MFTFVIPKFYRMKERLLEFLKRENKSSAQLADEIGVQASGISHILSGRNNPSLDFILKMLEKYPFISTDWLLFGKGSIYKEPKMLGLFDEIPTQSGNAIDLSSNSESVRNAMKNSEIDFPDLSADKTVKESSISTESSGKPAEEVVKIVWFYRNNTFEEYYPR